jgi:hypothetical protein
MTFRLIFVPMLLVIGVAACDTSPTGLAADLSVIEAVNSCAPTDGPATSIVLRSPDKPFGLLLALTVWRPFNELPGAYSFRNGSEDGVAYFSEGGNFTPRAGSATGFATGSMQIDRVTRDSVIIGSFSVTLADKTPVTRPFRAKYRRTSGFCG